MTGRVTLAYIILLWAACAGHAAGDRSLFSPDTVPGLEERGTRAAAPEYSFFVRPWENPAARQYQMPFGISGIKVGYTDLTLDGPRIQAAGRGEREWEAAASTYMKYKSSTLWGKAFYDNGRQLALKWNETADAAMLYPHLMADSVGGDLKLERYAFMGGYADSRGRWSWGVQLGYLAGLYYRSVDPRPRDITGLLTIRLGGGFALSESYILGVGLKGERYRQTNEITFVSETYESKIYHTTGLGTHYVRFAGTGKNCRYTGWRYGGSVELIPRKESGAVASVSVGGFSFEKILTDLNRLPLVRVTDLDVALEAGWRGRTGHGVWMAKATLGLSRRDGDENVFGDPSMSVYPLISTLSKYSRQYLHAGVSALWSLWIGGEPALSVLPEVEYHGLRERYGNPDRRMDIDALAGKLTLRGAFRLPWKLRCAVRLHGEVRAPLGHTLFLDGTSLNDDKGLVAALESDYAAMTAKSGEAGISADITRAISRRFLLRVEGGWSRLFHEAALSGNGWNVGVALLF